MISHAALMAILANILIRNDYVRGNADDDFLIGDAGAGNADSGPRAHTCCVALDTLLKCEGP